MLRAHSKFMYMCVCVRVFHYNNSIYYSRTIQSRAPRRNSPFPPNITSLMVACRRNLAFSWPEGLKGQPLKFVVPFCEWPGRTTNRPKITPYLFGLVTLFLVPVPMFVHHPSRSSSRSGSSSSSWVSNFVPPLLDLRRPPVANQARGNNSRSNDIHLLRACVTERTLTLPRDDRLLVIEWAIVHP